MNSNRAWRKAAKLSFPSNSHTAPRLLIAIAIGTATAIYSHSVMGISLEVNLVAVILILVIAAMLSVIQYREILKEEK